MAWPRLPTQKNSGKGMSMHGEMLTASAYTLLCVYAALEGKREAFYWHFKGIKEAEDLHATFLLQRFIVWLITLLLSWKLALSFACAFPFWHLGVMYHYRRKLNGAVYKHGFFSDNSNTGTQRIKIFKTLFFSFRGRFLFFVLSIILLLI
jgi:hypothetical protein